MRKNSGVHYWPLVTVQQKNPEDSVCVEMNIQSTSTKDIELQAKDFVPEFQNIFANITSIFTFHETALQKMENRLLPEKGNEIKKRTGGNHVS